MTPPSPTRQTLLSTAQTLIDGYNERTVAAALSFRAPHCIHDIYPLSLNKAPMDNEAYANFIKEGMSHSEEAKLVVYHHKTIVDLEKRMVVLQGRSVMKSVVGEVENECVLFLRMTEGGDKIEKIDQWMDSAVGLDFMEKLRGFYEEGGKAP